MHHKGGKDVVSENIEKISFICQLENCVDSYCEIPEPNYKLMITAHEV